MSRKLARHACADYLYDLRGFQAGDTVFCCCKRMWTLVERDTITFRQMVASWFRPITASVESDRVAWIRDCQAERADQRQRDLRAAADQRPCRGYDPTLDGE